MEAGRAVVAEDKAPALGADEAPVGVDVCQIVGQIRVMPHPDT